MKKLRSQPAPVYRRLRGIVLCYDDERGVGYITSDAGDIAVAKKDILIQPPTLKKSQEVVFDLYEGPDCLYAAFVTANDIRQSSRISVRYHLFCRWCRDVVPRAERASHEQSCVYRVQNSDTQANSIRCVPTAPIEEEDRPPPFSPQFVGDSRGESRSSKKSASRKRGILRFRCSMM